MARKFKHDARYKPVTLYYPLLEDPSEVVREAIVKELASFGVDLEDALDQLPAPPDAHQREVIFNLLSEPAQWRSHQQERLRSCWASWYTLPEPIDKLETALGFLADFLEPPNFPKTRETAPIGKLLDDLAEAFGRQDGSQDALTLAKFLFETIGLKGIQDQYYDPRKSSVRYVLETRQGIPISLACIYLLIGHRRGLDIRGCNWPGHFLARTPVGGTWMLVDCFNGGHALDQESFLKMQGPSREAALLMLEDEPTVETILARVLHNLVRAFRQYEDGCNADFIIELLKDLKQHGMHHPEPPIT